MQLICGTLRSSPSMNYELMVEIDHTAAREFLRRLRGCPRQKFLALECGQVDLVECVKVGVVGVSSSRASEGVGTFAVAGYGHV